jgi:anti-sigma regulatory factor (Ser/Thr protein kinase)
MERLLERWQSWQRRRKPATVWNTRVERDRVAIGRFSDAVEQRLSGCVPHKAMHDILVAFDELLTNVVMHAEQAAGSIDIELRYNARAIEATISYISTEFDPTTWRAAPAGMTVATLRIGGLGIQLVRTLMDEFRYEYLDGRNVLKLLKRC